MALGKFKGSFILFLILSATTLIHLTTVAQQNQCTGDGIYLYEHANFGGTCHKLTGDLNDFESIGFNDTVSSIRFVGNYSAWNYQVTLCEDAHYSGDCSPFFIGDDNDLSDNVVGNNRASSMRLEPLVATESLKVVTFNIQNLPLLFFAPETHNGCCEDIPDRVRKISETLIAGGYDIIVLNEAFTGGYQDGLVRRLREYYPHYVKQLHDDDGIDQDSGLMLFSRYPFVPIESNPYPPETVHAYNGVQGDWNDVSFIEYEDLKLPSEYDVCNPNSGCVPHNACTGTDCLADKGIAYVPIVNPYSGRVYHTLFTHLQAGGSTDGDSFEAVVRNRQLEAVEELIRNVILSGRDVDELTETKESIFFMGDLNFEGDTTKSPEDNAEWDKHFNTDGSFFTDVLTDPWAHEFQPDLPDEFIDPGLTSSLHRGPEEGSYRYNREDDWGSSRNVTALAMGDVDGDGRDEFALGRNSGDHMRWAIYRYEPSLGQMERLGEAMGTSWGDSREVTALAMGDVDGDGHDELAVGRNPGDGMRWAVYRYNPATDEMEEFHAHSGGGDSRGVTALAMGDVDGDGRDELAVGRNPGDGMRWAVYRYNATTDQMEEFHTHSGGGGSRGVTALAMGDVDGDGHDELAIGRNRGDNMRWTVYRYEPSLGQMERLGDEMGTTWGETREVTALTMGDMNGDGRDELAVGRNAGDNMRWSLYHFDSAAMQMVPLTETWGTHWSNESGVSAFAIGNVDGDGWADLAVAGSSARWVVYSYLDLFRRVQVQHRLDYFLWDNQQSDETLCIQHISLAHNLRHGLILDQVAFGTVGFQDLSDHAGLNIDLNLPADYCNPAQAWVNPPLDKFIKGKVTHPGSVQWYRIDDPGTYSISARGNGIDYHVYASIDLSSPLRRSHNESNTYGWIYNITDGPFYIKVFSEDRAWQGDYRIIIHKHDGSSKEDAVTLFPNQVLTSNLVGGIEEGKALWYQLQTGAPDNGQAQNLLFFAEIGDEPTRTITLELRSGDGNQILDSASGTSPSIQRSFSEDNDARLFLIVRLDDIDEIGEQLRAGWMTNLTVIEENLPYPLKLQADIETGDFGIGEDDDDVTITIRADGENVVERVNLGDFDAGQVRGLGDIFTRISFLNSSYFRLVEQDGLSPDDVMDGYIVSLPVEISGSIPGRYSLTGDGGLYDFYFVRSHGPMEATPRDTPLVTYFRFPVIVNKPGPDLIVESVDFNVDDELEVTIKNEGTLPTSYPFWLDLYVDPDPVPTKPNDIWADGRSKYGLVWHIGSPVPPGESITLTIDDPGFRPQLSRFPGKVRAGTPIYLQVDSANTETTFGGVHEMHELFDVTAPYNNIVVVEFEEDVIIAAPLAASHLPGEEIETFLPLRPTRR